MTHIIDGKSIAADLRNTLAGAVAELQQNQSIQPGLAVVLVGDDPASKIYVNSKAKQTKECGMVSFQHILPADTPQQELLALIEKLNNDPAVNGILVQLPLPAQINEDAVISSIIPEKDVDGFHPINVGRVATTGDGMVPCTPLAASRC